MVATTPASRKAKGRRFQQAVRQDLIDHLGINPGDILSTAMGQSGCDLYLSPAARERFGFGVECKAQETISLPAWWKQCENNASKVELTPLLLIKRNREDALAVMRWEDLLRLIELISRGEISGEPPDLTEALTDDHRWQNLAEGLTGGERP